MSRAALSYGHRCCVRTLGRAKLAVVVAGCFTAEQKGGTLRHPMRPPLRRCWLTRRRQAGTDPSESFSSQTSSYPEWLTHELAGLATSSAEPIEYGGACTSEKFTDEPFKTGLG